MNAQVRHTLRIVAQADVFAGKCNTVFAGSGQHDVPESSLRIKARNIHIL